MQLLKELQKPNWVKNLIGESNSKESDLFKLARCFSVNYDVSMGVSEHPFELASGYARVFFYCLKRLQELRIEIKKIANLLQLKHLIKKQLHA